MSTIARVTAPILLILAAYIGGGAELMLQHSLAGTGDATWIIAILIAGLANLASVLWLQRDASARSPCGDYSSSSASSPSTSDFSPSEPSLLQASWLPHTSC